MVRVGVGLPSCTRASVSRRSRHRWRRRWTARTSARVPPKTAEDDDGEAGVVSARISPYSTRPWPLRRGGRAGQASARRRRAVADEPELARPRPSSSAVTPIVAARPWISRQAVGGRHDDGVAPGGLDGVAGSGPAVLHHRREGGRQVGAAGDRRRPPRGGRAAFGVRDARTVRHEDARSSRAASRRWSGARSR